MLLETQGIPSQQGAEEGQLLNGRKQESWWADSSHMKVVEYE